MAAKVLHPYIEKVLKIVKQRDSSEPVFLQAVHEVLTTLSPVIEEHPQFIDQNLLERICEPERQVLFRVAWMDDENNIHINRGFRVHFNSTLGPYKGGLRFHPTVDLGVVKFLGFEQTFKNSLTGLQIGGGKGGSDFDPKGKSDNEVMRFCQSFMSELFRHIGTNTDVPAGDIGVGSREIGFLFGQYKKLTNRFDLGVLTGKGENIGGSLARKEATGFGCIYFAREVLATKGEDLKGKTCVVSGSGNVALYAIKKLQDLGAKVVAASDSSGSVYDKDGIDFALLKDIKEVKRGRIAEYAEKRKSAQFRKNKNVWDIPCFAAFPCAHENELNDSDANILIKNNCKLVCEGANMPTTEQAFKLLMQNGVLFVPGKAANAGGVAVSGLEMQQNAGWVTWTFEEVDQRLQIIMKRIHALCLQNAIKFSTPEDYVAGANIGGFMRVANGMMSYGLI